MQESQPMTILRWYGMGSQILLRWLNGKLNTDQALFLIHRGETMKLEQNCCRFHRLEAWLSWISLAARLLWLSRTLRIRCHQAVLVSSHKVLHTMSS